MDQTKEVLIITAHTTYVGLMQKKQRTDIPCSIYDSRRTGFKSASKMIQEAGIVFSRTGEVFLQSLFKL